MIHNPILPGFHADPCICRKGDDFYVAVSSFEWFPGIPIYHSKDMKNWELYSHALINADDSDLVNLAKAACKRLGIAYSISSCKSFILIRTVTVRIIQSRHNPEILY